MSEKCLYCFEPALPGEQTLTRWHDGKESRVAHWRCSKVAENMERQLAALREAVRSFLDVHDACSTETLISLLQGEGGECLHRFMYFGDQKKRRCADCNIQEQDK